MIPKRIAGSNANPGAPAGWDPSKDGSCSHLAVRVVFEDLGGGKRRAVSCESAWEPTPKELEMLNRGGHVILKVMGWQVPVMLTVEAAAEDAPNIYRDKCKRLRADGPTPCLYCEGECRG